MIDNNILQSLGAGSGIDTQNLTKQLVEIEKAAPQQRLDSRTELTETRISDFGTLTSALSNLKDAAALLTDPEALFSKTASFTDSDALVPLELDTDVQAGTYAFNVSQIARAHTLVFGGFSSTNDSIGEGTLTFNFGAYARDGNGDIDLAEAGADRFVQDTDHTAVEITIDSTNDTLEGLRDKINEEDFGVTASIIFDGSTYNLSIVAESGADNELEIVVDDDDGLDADTGGLSRFFFDSTNTTEFDALITADATDVQGGENAILTLNGINIERSSNTIDDIVEGLTLDVLKTMSASETVTITISEDKSFAEQNVRTFVESYNTFLEALDPIFGSNEVENEDGDKELVVGSLANDALAKSLLTQIRTVISSSIPGLVDSEYTSLTNIGIRTEIDGTLSIDENDFRFAFDNRFEDVQKLLAPYTDSSSSDAYINSFNDNTEAGEYELIVTNAPTQGIYEGSGITLGDIDTSTKTYSFTVDINGTSSASLTLPDTNYATEDELAGAIQLLINSDAALLEAGASVVVEYNAISGGMDITANGYGSGSTVEFTALSGDADTELGFNEEAGTPGETAAGTFGGVAGFGSANVLLPTLGEDAEGLAVVIGENVTLLDSITLNFSRGFAGELERLVDAFLESDGVIATRTETLNDNLDSFEADQERLDRRIGIYEERLLNQFIAMERILNSLGSSGSFLDNLIDTLPFTASKR